jgi:predicted  nucleic acid-binding Zn-ribbon protein
LTDIEASDERPMLMSESLNLFRLQKLDSEIDGTRARLEEIERALSDDRRLKTANKKFEKAQDDLKGVRIKLHQIEDKVEAQRLKRKTSQNALFSGKIKNPKELQDLQMETEALKRYISQLEDEQLEVMIAFEAAEEHLEEAQQNLDQIKGSLIEENASLIGEQSKLEEKLERLLREKEAVHQAISVKTLLLYNQLRERNRGIAVTTISDGGCSICGQSITPADLQSIRSAATLVFCPSCGRILYEG